MESGLVVLTVVVMIAVGVFIFLMDKAKTAASRALSQKVLYRKKFEQGKHLLEGMTLDAAASSERLLRELQTRVAVSDRPTGLASQLYTAGRQGNRIEYVYGNKFGDSFRARVVILEHGERSLGIFKVVRWHERDGIIVAQDWMKTLFEQVRAVVVAADSAATFTEGINDARLKAAAASDDATKSDQAPATAPPEPALSAAPEDAVVVAKAPAAPTAQVPAAPPIQAPAPIAAPSKKMNTWSYVGTALLAAAILWIGTVGVPGQLMPVWLLIAGAGGAMVYFSTRAPRAGAVPSGPARPVASAPPQSPAEPASRLEVPAPAEEPSVEEFQLAAEELGAAAAPAAEPATAAPAAASSKLVPRIVMAVAALVIVVIVGGALVSGISKEIDKADRRRAAEERQEEVVAPESDDDIDTSVTPDALSPDASPRSADDLLGSAPVDGTMQFVDVVYDGGSVDPDDNMLRLDFYLVGRDPVEWYRVVVPNDVGYYIDYDPADSFDFIMSMDHVSDEHRARGMLVFDDTSVYEAHIFTQGQKASASTPEKDQVTVVPDYESLDLPFEAWYYLDPEEWFETHDATVEWEFQEAGLDAEITWEAIVSGEEEPSQTPPAGSVVPVGTTVHITLYTAE